MIVMDMFNGLDAAFKGMDNVNKILENSALNTAMKSIAHLDKLDIDSLKYPPIPSIAFSLQDIANYKSPNFDFLSSAVIMTAMNKINTLEFAESYIDPSSSYFKLFNSIKINLTDLDYFKDNQIQLFSDYLAKTISYDIVENHTDEKEIEEILNYTNEIVLNVKNTTDKDALFEFLDNIQIYIYSKVNLSNTLILFSSIMINLISSYLYDLAKQETTPQVNVSKDIIINNTYNTTNIINKFYGEPLLIKEILISNSYVSSLNKELKIDRNTKSKTIISIQTGTSFKVIKKFNKWVYISVIVDGIYYNGFIKIDNLYKLAN